MSRKRAVIAGGLSLVYPGLGHFYLREWVRGIAWIGLAIFTASLVVPDATLAAFESDGLSGLWAASRALPLSVLGALAAVRVLNALDAAWLGLRPEPTADTGASCPHCGGELDEELSFCPWCTTRLEEPERPADPTNP